MEVCHQSKCKGVDFTQFSYSVDVAVASRSLLEDDITKLWHMRLGRMSENDMVELSRRRLLDG